MDCIGSPRAERSVKFDVHDYCAESWPPRRAEGEPGGQKERDGMPGLASLRKPDAGARSARGGVFRRLGRFSVGTR